MGGRESVLLAYEAVKERFGAVLRCGRAVLSASIERGGLGRGLFA